MSHIIWIRRHLTVQILLMIVLLGRHELNRVARLLGNQRNLVLVSTHRPDLSKVKKTLLFIPLGNGDIYRASLVLSAFFLFIFVKAFNIVRIPFTLIVLDLLIVIVEFLV